MANEQNLRPPFSKDNPNVARENQKKSVEARKRNKKKKEALSAILEDVLNQPVTDEKHLRFIKKNGLPVPAKPKYRDFFVASIVISSVKRGSVDDLAKIIEILGENNLDNGQDTNETDALSKSLIELAKELEDNG